MRFLALLLILLSAGPALAEDVLLWRSDNTLNAAEKLLADKKYADVLTVTDKIVARNIRNADAHVAAAQAWMGLNNLDKAKQSLNNAIAIDRGHLGAYVLSGLVALRQGDPTQAGYFLSALKVVCQGDLCMEYGFLEKTIREYKPEVLKP